MSTRAWEYRRVYVGRLLASLRTYVARAFAR